MAGAYLKYNMCGFLVYQKYGNNFFIQKRGQDHTNQVTRNGFTFVHNLLSVTGDFTPQPYIDGDIICVYNGEIYNHPFKKSDGENLIPLYKQYGPDFVKHLDGEWAIALYDFKKSLTVFATDLFATKPIWRNGLECASYESGVGGYKIPANTVEVVHFDGHTEIYGVYKWDLTQHKDSCDDWISTFKKSVKKRATPGCFIGLSSGYDSGAIACELLNLKSNFKAYTIMGREDKNILMARANLVPNHEYLDDFSQEKNWLDTNVEDFEYKISQDFKKDSAALALSKMCRQAHLEGRKVYLSGHGADEIIADYALKPHLSTFRGHFPNKLTLWENFYDGCQYSYLGKEEYVAGSHAIETRYPFLDRDVVQEFLWLSADLKNRRYKSPIYEYLSKYNFPTAYDKKVGLTLK